VQHLLLWDMALASGAIILHLAVLRRLNSLPRFQTRALQIRAELRSYVEAGNVPFVPQAMMSGGLDALIVQLFDDCCAMWLHLPRPRSIGWFGRELKAAGEYVRFMKELAAHLVGGNEQT
jgi:hypothetical protein